MYVATVPNRDSPPAILLRESYRADGKVKSRTLANLSEWPKPKIDALRRVLQGEVLVPVEQVFTIERSLPHGHVAAVLGSIRRLELDRMVAAKATRDRDLVIAMVVARLIDPRSKLALAQSLGQDTSLHTLGEALGLESASEDQLYEAMDWLLSRQSKIEAALAKRHLSEGTLALYDVTSTYFEGRTCPLARLGHSRDGKKDKLQIVFGLLCDPAGCPIAVEVFEGNTGDPKTLASAIHKIRDRFEIKRVVLVGDRGMMTEARIREELKPVEGLDWISALRAPAIQQLVKRGSLQLGLFDERDLAEIHDPLYPDERLIVCRNPLLAEERGRKREELLQATERELQKILDATRRTRKPLRGRENIGLQLGKILGRYKMGKHFRLTITDETLRFERKREQIVEEAALDGFYVIRTSVPKEKLSAVATVRAYKGLSAAERAFRSLKTIDLHVRPIHHRLADRVRAHVLLCMLAYYVEWHMRRALAPILFDDDDKKSAARRRRSVVAPAQRSTKAEEKAATRRTEEGYAVMSFQGLLKHLASLTKNRIRANVADGAVFEQYAQPTSQQRRALELLKVSYKL
jgi:transposase